MRSLKMFGLAALAALMAMAFVGASSAMAESTALCNVDPGAGATEVCPAGHLITEVKEDSVGKAKLLTSLLTIECDVLFSGTTRSSLANPLIIDGTFKYDNCNNNCKVTEESSPAEIKVLKEGHETGKVTGEGLVHTVCGTSIDCSYNGTGLVGAAKGPLLAKKTIDIVEGKEINLTENGEVSIQEQATAKEAGGFLCPKTAKLDIVTSPLSATYITN